MKSKKPKDFFHFPNGDNVFFEMNLFCSWLFLMPYHSYGMASQVYKATYTLDKESLEIIENLASLWKISKAEVIRRCVKNELERIVHKPSPLGILELLDSKPEYLVKEEALEEWNKQRKESLGDWDR